MQLITYWLKICIFLLPLFHSAPLLAMFPIECNGEVTLQLINKTLES